MGKKSLIRKSMQENFTVEYSQILQKITFIPRSTFIYKNFKGIPNVLSKSARRRYFLIDNLFIFGHENTMISFKFCSFFVVFTAYS